LESNEKSYFFKGNQYVRLTGTKVDPGYPKSLPGGWRGLPTAWNSGIDAAFFLESKEKSYFFKGSQYIRLTGTKVDSNVEAKVLYPLLDPDKPGFVSKVDNDFCDRCVPDVKKQVTETLHDGKDQADIMAYRSGGGGPTKENGGLQDWDRDKWKHRQGIARYHSGDRNYFYVSSSARDDWGYGGFEIVSWDDKSSSGHLGSNIQNDRRQSPGTKYRVIKYIQEDESNHAGGIQIMGRFLVVPYFAARDYILLYDLEDPLSPRTLAKLESSEDTKFGFAALTRLNNGRYLVIGGDDKIEVFVTKGTSPTDAWEFQCSYTPGDGFVDDPFGPVNEKYQSAQFVTDCSGILYLVATRKSQNSLNRYQDDWIDVWRSYVRDNDGRYSIELRKEFNRHMYCGGGGDSLWCNFSAGAGIYVDRKTGELLVYGVEHWNDGPKVSGVGSTKMKEFRQRSETTNLNSHEKKD
jgi:hypothetical protein